MKKVDVLQNTEEWIELRKTRLGASDANIIMKQSKFMTPFQLWEKQLGINQPKEEEEEKNTFAQDKGHLFERKMRGIMGMLFMTDFTELVVLSDEYPFLMASLDGYSEDNGSVWENKYVGQADFDIVDSGQMLEKYIPQVQQQLLMTGAPFCVFSVITEDKESTNKDFPFKYAYIEVQPDHDYMKKKLLPAMRKFWKNVTKKIAPDYVYADVVDYSDSDELTDLLGEYKEVSLTIENLTKKEKEIHKMIFKFTKVKKSFCNGIKMMVTAGRTVTKIDYEKFIEDQSLEVDPEYISTKKNPDSKKISFPEPESEIKEA